MTQRFVRMGAALVAVALALAPDAGAQTVTGSIRGRVLSDAGTPVSSATVTATNTETGVARAALADAEGRFRLHGLAPGPYAVQARAIGHRPLEKRGYRLTVGAELVIDFTLALSAVELTAIPVEVEETPLVDPTRSGVTTTVSQSQIEGLPTNGRNFTDFLALAPTFTKTPAFGSGLSIGSIGGGRQGGTVLQIDGVSNTGAFFGGDARGSDRLPIAFSIEAVREFQVITNEYDVTKGGFTGGLINAVTKTGTNRFHGTLFEYFRDEALTNRDFLGNDPRNFRSNQFGLSVGGPIIRDRAHFFFAIDRQVRNEPATAIASDVLGIPDSTLNQLDSIIRNVYQVDPGPRGTVLTELNEWALFGRLDFALSDRHRLAIRDNATFLDLVGDRISTGGSNTYDYFSAGGPQKPKANSFVVNLFSNLSSSLYNEFKFQYATDRKRRPPQVTYPQVRVFLGGHFVTFGADSILHHNNLEETVFQFSNVLTFNRGAHQIQVGTDNTHTDFFNLFFNNGRGTYTFNWGADSLTLDSLGARHASAFTLALPFDSANAALPTAKYNAWSWSFFLQDKWQATSRLVLNGGLRLDVPKVNGVPRDNAQLLDSFPQFFLAGAALDRWRNGTPTAADSATPTTGRQVAVQYNWAPRLGFAYDLFGDQRTVVRGGAGVFYGYTPFVFWSNMFLNTGRDQRVLNCNVATATATQGVDLNAAVDTVCGGPGAAPPTPFAFFFSNDYQTPKNIKYNIGIDHGVTRNLAVGAEVAWSEGYDNFVNQDVNLRTDSPRILTGEGGRIVIGTAPGSSGSSARRVDPRFFQVLLHETKSRNDYVAVVGSLRYRTERVDFSGSYTYSRARDDFSRSCCTSTSQYSALEAGANLNSELQGNFSYSENDVPHYAVLSGLWRAPLGLRVSMLWRTFSGRPFTPAISSTADANGDGTRGNDRAYIPRNRADISIDGNGAGAGTGTALEQDSAFAVLDGLINRWECLVTQRGRIATRNSCRNPSRSLLDVRVSREFRLVGSQSVEFVVDFFNVLNGFNRRWGRATSPDGSLLRIRGFDAVNNRYIYEVQQTFGRQFLEAGGDLAQFQMQLGARYRF